MKQLIRNILNRFGFDITRRNVDNNIHLYDKYPPPSLVKRRFYNIGAGSFRHPYWTNIDYATEHYDKVQSSPFLNYNLMELKPLPIEDNVAELVYSSHTIEHVNDAAVLNVLRESYRILKPGGGIRLTTPDAKLGLAAYLRKDTNFWYWVDAYSKPGAWKKLYKMPLSNASLHQLFLHHYASQLCEIDIDGDL